MADQPKTKSSTSRKRWPRLVGLLAGVVILLVVVAYFIVTSSAFFKGIVLPRAGKALNARVTVTDASISPFSRVVLHNIELTPDGAETLLTAGEVRLEYNLRAILGGNIQVSQVLIENPTITVIQKSDGTSNLDPILRSTGKTEGAEKPAGSTKPPQLDIKQVALKNATVKVVQKSDSAPDQTMELTGLNFELNDLKNAGKATINLGADLKIDQPSSNPGESASLLLARIEGSGSFQLTPQLGPESAEATASFTVSRAAGKFSELNESLATLNCAITPTEVKQLGLEFSRGGASLGSIVLHGPFDPAKMEGNLSLDIGPLDRKALNLVGAPLDLDFGSTQLQSTNEIRIEQQAALVTVRGKLLADDLSITQHDKSTPPYKIDASYEIALNRNQEKLEVKALNIVGSRNGAQILTTALNQPLVLSTRTNQDLAGNSTLKLSVTRLELADWNSWLAEMNPSGQLSADVNLTSTHGKLGVSAKANIQNLNARLGQDDIKGANLELGLDANAASLEPLRADLKASLNVSSGVMATADESATPLPLKSSLHLAAGLEDQILKLDELRLALAPTDRAKNELLVSGSIDRSKPNLMQVRLKIQSEALDIGDYYDLLTKSSESRQGQQASVNGEGGQPAPQPATEPEPVTLPFRDSTIDLNLQRVILREIDIHNWHARIKLDGGSVEMDPFALDLNGSPVTAYSKLNLDVPGYRYDVRFSAEKIPVAPLADSFSPAYHGKARGDLSASIDLKGDGITGASLRQTLAGGASVVFTNANIQLVGPKARILVGAIALALRQPSLMDSPLSWLAGDLKFENGEIVLPRFELETIAFRAGTEGRIPIADDLMQSPLNSLPIQVSLERSLADRAGLTPSNASMNAGFVELALFLHANGTLANPKMKTDPLVLAGITARTLGASKLIDGEAGKIIDKLGNIFSGEKRTNTDTNVDTAAPVFNPFKLFKKSTPQTTNSPSKP